MHACTDGGISYLNATEDETIEFGTPKVGIKNYPEDYQQQWVLIVPEGRQVHIDFDIFELEESEGCKYDYLEIREADPNTMRGYRGPILTGRLCGSTLPSTIQSAGNLVWLQFMSNDNATTVYKGFKASFKPGLYKLGGAVASWLVRSSPDRQVMVRRALAGVTVFCSCARHLTLTVPLSTQEYKWVPANCWGNLTN